MMKVNVGVLAALAVLVTVPGGCGGHRGGSSVTRAGTAFAAKPIVYRDRSAPVPAGGRPAAAQPWTVPDIGLQFVWIPAMNCWVARYELTNGEYRKFDPQHDSRDFERVSLNGDRQPVVFVSYDDAVAFAQWLTRREDEDGRLPEGWVYRLPDAQEWTTFAQCGDGREWPWGSQWPPRYGNYADERARGLLGVRIEGYHDGDAVTCPVERSGASPWGLCGVGGNVSEWTSAGRGTLRMARGGSWYDYLEDFLKCSFQDEAEVSNRTFSIGFRLMLAPIASDAAPR
jgi:formylglycine-generating enzyme required for sulfatase activity